MDSTEEDLRTAGVSTFGKSDQNVVCLDKNGKYSIMHILV